jgi:hypothetical protein
LALSAIAGPKGEGVPATSCGGVATVASGLNSTRKYDLELARIPRAGRRIPAFAEALAERIDLALRQLRGPAVRLSERR